MKKIYNYTFQLVCIYILVLSLFSVSNIELTIDNYDANVHNVNSEKTVDSTLLALNNHVEVKEEESINKVDDSTKQEVKIEDSSIDTNKQEEIKEEKEEIKESTLPQETVNIIDTSSYQVLSNETVTISHYGHDCYGCTSGYTAGGYYVGDGRIYYQDATFGSVRVVAADKKYPIGSIIRLGYGSTTITAIVLDRGGGIGDGKRFQIDLLESSEQVANSQSVIYNSQLEVLRLGY